MGINLSNLDISALYLGSNQVTSINLGSNNAWVNASNGITILGLGGILSQSAFENRCIGETVTFFDTQGSDIFISSSTNYKIVNQFSPDPSAIIAYLDGGRATEIQYSTFAGTAIVTASFPNVTEIGQSVFSTATSLVSASFPRLSIIGPAAFTYCTSLVSASFKKVINVGEGAFQNANIQYINLPKAQIISASAFAGVHWDQHPIDYINLPKVEFLGTSVFQERHSVPATINLPEVLTLGDQTFYECLSLSTLNAPKLTIMGDQTINATSIISASFPNLISIGVSNTGENISYAYLPKLEYLGGYNFTSFNSGIITGSFPNLTSYGPAAIQYANNLVKLETPKLPYIDNNLINWTPALKEIDIRGLSGSTALGGDPTSHVVFNNNNTTTNGSIRVPIVYKTNNAGGIDANLTYLIGKGWNIIYNITDGFKVSGISGSINQSQLSQRLISSSISLFEITGSDIIISSSTEYYMSSSAFKNNNDIIAYEDRGKCLEIRNSSFENASNLQSVVFDLATSIGTNAFASCSLLSSASFISAKTVNVGAFTNFATQSISTRPTITLLGLSGSSAIGGSPGNTGVFTDAVSSAEFINPYIEFPIYYTYNNNGGLDGDLKYLENKGWNMWWYENEGISIKGPAAFLSQSALESRLLIESGEGYVTSSLLSYNESGVNITASINQQYKINVGAFQGDDFTSSLKSFEDGGYCFRIDTEAFNLTEPSAYNLATASFPGVSYIGQSAFAFNTYGIATSSLVSINFPNATYIDSNAFAYQNGLTNLNFPKVQTISPSAFEECKSVVSASFESAEWVYTFAFYNCFKLKYIYLPSLNSEYSLNNKNGDIFNNIATNGDIYVPSFLSASYNSSLDPSLDYLQNTKNWTIHWLPNPPGV